MQAEASGRGRGRKGIKSTNKELKKLSALDVGGENQLIEKFPIQVLRETDQEKTIEQRMSQK